MKRILKQIRKNPVYRKAVIVVLFSVFLFICVYIRDNSRKLMTDENGREIIKRSSEAGKEESIELKVKAGEVEESVSITVSGQAFGGEELKKKFEETSENLEKLILGENEDLDNVREDLNLITEIPDTGISVTWELDNYEVMDIRGGLRQENLIEEGTLVKLTALLRYEEEKAACEFYARVFPPRMNSSEKMIQKITLKQEKASACPLTDQVGTYLYEPNVAILKAGAFRSLTQTYPVMKLHLSSHLYTSASLVPDFPGRRFRVESVSGFGKKELKAFLKDMDKANITIRNFPLSVAELRKRLKLKEGGDDYIFATTLSGGQKVLIRGKKC